MPVRASKASGSSGSARPVQASRNKAAATRKRKSARTRAAAPKATPVAAKPATAAKPAAAPKPATTPPAELKLSTAAANAIRNARPGPYELIPGRYPGTVSLPELLSRMGASPHGQAAVNQLLDVLQQASGIRVSSEVRAALLSNPSAATNALEVTPRQLSQGMVAMNVAHHAGQLRPIQPRVHLLPRTGFDLKDVGSLEVPRANPELRQVAPGLFRGSLPSTVPDAQLKLSRVMAEVLDRLADNDGNALAERFNVSFMGATYDRVDTLLEAMRAHGYEVNVTFEQRAANFADLKTPVPGSDPVQWLDVPAPLMVRTGVRDAAGQEAVIPAAHSEMIVSITSGPSAQEPRLDADVRYFQGIDGTGFFARGGAAEPQWLGRVTHAQVQGADAVKAVKLAGVFGDVIRSAARAANLYADGYGITGVCNDTVAVIQQALTGRADQYPLFMRDELLVPELQLRLEQAATADEREAYAVLLAAIEALPNDVRANETQRERAAKSIPYAEGSEPFQSTVTSRRILSTE